MDTTIDVALDATDGYRSGDEAALHVFSKEPHVEPEGEEACRVAVDRLGERIRAVPMLVELIARNIKGAAQTASDRFQGLKEIVQNADDAGASSISFALREVGGGHDLLVAHDGTKRVTLLDVVGLSSPGFSNKAEDPDSIGRFGIGFKIVHSFCDRVDVHDGHYHFEANGTRLRSIEPEVPVPGFYDPNQATTLFRLRLRRNVPVDALRDWIVRQDESNLPFLRTLRKLSLIGLGGGESVRRHLTSREIGRFAAKVGGEDVEISHVAVEAANGLAWDRFDVRVPVPDDLERSDKKAGETSPMAVAVPRGGSAQPLYVAFPMKVASRVPLALNAQFDPVASRETMLETDWNRWLVERLGELVGEVALHLLATDAARGWAAIPQEGETYVCEDDSWIPGAFDEAFEKVRRTVAARGALPGGIPFSQIAYEAKSLEGVALPGDAPTVVEGRFGVPLAFRGEGDRWRDALAEIDGPERFEADAFLAAVGGEAFDDRSPEWFVELLAKMSGLGVAPDSIRRARLVVDAGGNRHEAKVRGESAAILLSGVSASGFALRHGLAIELHEAYDTPAGGWAKGWLREHATFMDEVGARDLLAAYANLYKAAPREIGDAEFVELRDLFERVPEGEVTTLGARVGEAILLSCRHYVDGKAAVAAVRAADAYLPQSYERDGKGWGTAAGRTAGMRWVDPDYEKLLAVSGRRKGGEQRSRGARAFLTILGVRNVPKIVNVVGEAQWYTARPAWAPAIKFQVYADHRSPDLLAVLKDIEADKGEGAQRAAILFRTLARAWDRHGERSLERQSVAKAGRHGKYGWNLRKEVPASWLADLIDRKWFRDEAGVKSKPSELTVRSPRSESLYGTSARYAAELRPEDMKSGFADAVGIERREAASRILAQLEDMRDGRQVADPGRIMRCYIALAEQCPPASATGVTGLECGDVPIRSLRGKFGLKGRGLLFDPDEGDWKSPPAFYRGPEIFKGVRPRVPSVQALLPLWLALGIKEPTVSDCVKAFVTASRTPPSSDLDGFLVNVFQHVGKKSREDKPRRGLLPQIPLACGDVWVTKRPVYVVRGFEDGRALAGEAARLRLWTPPCDVRLFADILEPLGVEQVVPTVLVSSEGEEDDLAQDRFDKAVMELADRLARNAPDVYAAIDDWKALDAMGVTLHDGGVRLQVASAAWKGKVPTVVRAHVEDGVLHAADLDALSDAEEGGRVVAGLFSPSVRHHVAMAWASAWTRAETRTGPAIRLADDRDDTDYVKGLASAIDEGLKARPKAASVKPDEGAPAKDAAMPHKKVVERVQRLRDFDPELSAEVSLGAGGATPGKKPAGRTKLTNGGGTGKGAGTGRREVVRNEYKNVDVEDLGMRYAHHFLQHASNGTLEDIRLRRGGGADATIDWKTFVEVKAFYGGAPSSIGLTAHETERARKCGRDFILAIVSGLGDDQDLEIRLVFDPLSNASWEANRGITLKSVAKANGSIVIKVFEPDAEDAAAV
ncbi:sacsin N-terminal ATP-binding-like domain-containing protein [Bosea sp. BH3]|uniref:sacsin N-terminal ATP-binding-like domain-containing protein n=1 Tax=Bosea sp. BH3 TaxID=2871701 RepID=UPI0021CB523A|nr:DUF3883 domain-containing protein [Bosea sp. BH3]MCU4181781.1 DUF3883 domain-containing protein [Bosea sp. BH3]